MSAERIERQIDDARGQIRRALHRRHAARSRERAALRAQARANEQIDRGYARIDELKQRLERVTGRREFV